MTVPAINRLFPILATLLTLRTASAPALEQEDTPAHPREHPIVCVVIPDRVSRASATAAPLVLHLRRKAGAP